METNPAPSRSSAPAAWNLGPEDEALYEQFIQTLIPIDEFFDSLNHQGITAQRDEFEMLEISQWVPLVNPFPSGSSPEKFDQTSQPTAPKCALKGADFAAWRKRKLETRPLDEYKRALYSECSLKEELTVLCTMPPHPNIIPRPPMLMFISASPERLYGFLQPWREKETISWQIRNANQKRNRIGPLLKAKSCLGIAEGILHTHRVAKTFHMDLKPANVVVEDDDTVRIIDWEQQGMCRATHPPEATLGKNPKIQKIVDKMRLDQNGQPIVIFTPPEGTWPEEGLRDAYARWKAENSRGIEAAELFMMAKTFWYLLEQKEEPEEGTTDPTVWSQQSMDIPKSWKEAVEACLVEDPAKRPTLETVVEFWKKQVEAGHARIENGGCKLDRQQPKAFAARL